MKVRQELGQSICCEILRNAEPDDALASWTRDNLTGLLLERENPPRIGKQPLALFGRLGLLSDPMQQRIAQTFLKPPDLLAHRRLRSVNAFTRVCESAGVDHRDETAQ